MSGLLSLRERVSVSCNDAAIVSHIFVVQCCGIFWFFSRQCAPCAVDPFRLYQSIPRSSTQITQAMRALYIAFNNLQVLPVPSRWWCHVYGKSAWFAQKCSLEV
eukprot:3031325-Amphidinium_carterae.1